MPTCFRGTLCFKIFSCFLVSQFIFPKMCFIDSLNPVGTPLVIFCFLVFVYFKSMTVSCWNITVPGGSLPVFASVCSGLAQSRIQAGSSFTSPTLQAVQRKASVCVCSLHVTFPCALALLVLLIKVRGLHYLMIALHEYPTFDPLWP